MEHSNAREHLYSMLPRADREALELLLCQPHFIMISFSVTLHYTEVVLKSMGSVWTIRFDPAITKD